MIYAYCRISTQSQSLDRQIQNIKEKYPDCIIIKEIFTGTKQNRPEWEKLIKKVKKNDTIVFDEVSRMSRNAVEGFETYKEMLEKEINLVFLKEKHINTDSYKEAMKNVVSMDENLHSGNRATDGLINEIMKAINKFMIKKIESDIEFAFESAENEIKHLSQRTKEGIEIARLNGKKIGRQKGQKIASKKEKLVKDGILKYSKDYNGNLNDLECMKLIGVARNTFYKYKHILKEETI